MTARTLYDKLWDSHVVREEADGTALLYIDRHLVHEVTSPQAFEGLKLAGRKPWRMQSVVATADHNTPTKDWNLGIQDPISRTQVETLDDNIRQNGAKAYFPFLDRRQGIVHVIGPEQGATLPGMTVVCGDSHTSTHGAFAALAFGIGTSEVEHVLATQCLLIKKAKSMLVRVDGRLAPGVTSKDLVLSIIGRIGTAGGRAMRLAGRARAVDGSADDDVQHVDEAGARAGMIAVDERTLTIKDARSRRLAKCGSAVAQWRRRRRRRQVRPTHVFDAAATPAVTWGTSPEMVVSIEDRVRTRTANVTARRDGMSARCTTWGLPNTLMTHPHRQGVHRSCTNRAPGPGRRRQSRAAAISRKRGAMVFRPGLVKAQAEAEGLTGLSATRVSNGGNGCSMCLAMNDDKLEPGERCASTSNRNFEGRQGSGGRTHLVSPAMAAGAAIAGHFVDVRRLV
jgi:3-isopropylmalate/(R)-2-methylmalate dehydratase large subunit